MKPGTAAEGVCSPFLLQSQVRIVAVIFSAVMSGAKAKVSPDRKLHVPPPPAHRWCLEPRPLGES